jgi:Protein phosphatase 2C
LKLVGGVTQGSGTVNEDGWGYVGPLENAGAAWVFDGVTGINGKNLLPGNSDAAWLVEQAHKHLLNLAIQDLSLPEILSRLVHGLIADWQHATKGLSIPDSYDLPAACLVLAKDYGGSWQAVGLGDSNLLVKCADGSVVNSLTSPPDDFEDWLKAEAAKRRDAGVLDVRKLLTEFRPQLFQRRKLRNRPDGYSILEADPVALEFAEYIELGQPDALLLCTDGYYRAVDHYALHSPESLVQASLGHDGIDRVLSAMRAVEASDLDCRKFLRFKPTDDATAVMLSA